MQSFKLIGALCVVAAVFAISANAASAYTIAKTESATDVTSTKATLHGTITGTLGGEVWYTFQYGKTTSYEYQTPAKKIPPSETYSHNVKEPLEGLEPDVYHFRLVAYIFPANGEAGGLAEGQDLTFTNEPFPRFQPVKGSFYPYEASGGLNSGTQFKMAIPTEELEWTCPSAKLSSPALWGGTTALQLGAEYSECVWPEQENINIRTNSCKYVFNVAKAGPPYYGPLGISCSKEGDTIELEMPEICTVKFPAQTASGEITYTNQGEGGEEAVVSKVAATNVSYTWGKPGWWCSLLNGLKGNDATIEFETTLSAVDTQTHAARGLRVRGLGE